MPIPGGYILQPRCIDSSDIMHEPPVVREIWFYLLRRVNHQDNDKFRRGTNFFNLGDIQEALHWYVGFRKQKYSKPQITKAIRRLYERNMVETRKATRGLVITILNYDYYQNPKSYESNGEGNTKETRRKHEGIHYKQEEECKKKEKERERGKSPSKKTEIPEQYLTFARNFYSFLSQEANGKKKYTEKEVRDGAATVEKLVRIDGYDLEEEIRPALRWGVYDDFWSAQIRSLSQLRKKRTTDSDKKFDNLFAQYSARRSPLSEDDQPAGSMTKEELDKIEEERQKRLAEKNGEKP